MSRITDPALAQWPLVTLDVSTLDPASATRRVGDALTAALERREPFAAVIRMPEGRPRRITGAGERVRLMKTLRPGLRDRCAGLAFVVSAEAQQANAKSIRAGAKLWGCPTTAVDDPDAARAWARGRLAAGTPDAEAPSAEEPDAEAPSAEEPDAEAPSAGEPDAEAPGAEGRAADESSTGEER